MRAFGRPRRLYESRYGIATNGVDGTEAGYRRTHSQLVFQAIQAVLAVASGFDPKASFWDRRAIGKAAGWLP